MSLITGWNPLIAATDTSLSHREVAVLFLAVGLLLLVARGLGELAKRFHLPAVLGELLAGVLLGKTVIGAVFPRLEAIIFPPVGNVPISLNALTTLGIALFLLVAGMEVDLSTVWRQGRSALAVAAAGMLVPFGIGFGAAMLAPSWLGKEPVASTPVFALFLAIALAITALPVIAKILMDLGLYRSNIGMIVVAAAILNDLVGWLVFAFLLGLIDSHNAHGPHVTTTIVLTLGFALFMMTLGRWLIDRVLPWFQAHVSWPGGIIGTALAVALVCAAFTEWIGVHAIFGAFMFGVAIGDSRHLREQTRTTLDQFISFFFAPLFFAAVGLQVNFFTNFDLPLLVIITVIATIGKVAGCGWAARLTGFPSRQAWAIGFGMNARGAMEIILGLLALEAGLISQRLFVALVMMAMLTSMFSGTMIQRALGGRQRVRLSQYLTAGRFVRLTSGDRRQAIEELLKAAAGENSNGGNGLAKLSERIQTREQLLPSVSEHGLAVVRASLPDAREPMVAVGVSAGGIDFNARDGMLTKLICLLLTPAEDVRLQRSLLIDIGRTFTDAEHVQHAAEVSGLTEFLALLNSGKPSERRSAK